MSFENTIKRVVQYRFSIAVLVAMLVIFTQQVANNTLASENFELDLKQNFRTVKVPSNCRLPSADTNESLAEFTVAEQKLIKAMTFGYVTGCSEAALGVVDDVFSPGYVLRMNATYLEDYKSWSGDYNEHSSNISNIRKQ